MRWWGLLGAANSAFPKGFPFCGLPSVAPYCAPGGVRVVSEAGGWYLRDSITGAFRHGDGGGCCLAAPCLASTASSSARSFPLLCGPPVLECPLTFLH